MSDGVYGPVHQRVLRLAAGHKDRAFRPSALLALAGLPSEQAGQITADLVAFGFLEQVTEKRKVYIGYGMDDARGADGNDSGVGYYRWVYDLMPDYRLTDDGKDEAVRRAKSPESDDVRVDESQALRAQIEQLKRENAKLTAALAERLRASEPRVCERCRAGWKGGSRYCHQCGIEAATA